MGSGIDYDDSNSAILYSSGWTTQTGTTSQQFMSTSHTTTVKGASATIKFQGTRLVLYLTVPEGKGEESISWTLDGGNAGSNTKHQHDGMTFYQDQWYDSGSLPMGTHTFVVSNAADTGTAPFVLDKVNIEGSLISAQPPKPPGTTAGPTTTPKPAQTQVQTVVSTRVQTVLSTSVVQSTIPDSSSTHVPSETGASLVSSSASGLSQSASLGNASAQNLGVSTFYVTTGADGATSTVHTVTELASATSPPFTISASQKEPFPIGAVIGGVIGALALIIFGLIFLCLMRRRNGSAAFGKIEEGGGQDMERKASQRRQPTDISPFHLNESTSGPGSVSRSGSNSSDASRRIAAEKSLMAISDALLLGWHPPGSSMSPSQPPSSTSRSNEQTNNSPLSAHSAFGGRTSHDHGEDNVDSGISLAYTPANHLLLSPRDSRGAPPSYQSASVHGLPSRRDTAPPPLAPLGIIESSNLSSSSVDNATLDYVSPVSAHAEQPPPGLGRVPPAPTAPTNAGISEKDMPWAHGW